MHPRFLSKIPKVEAALNGLAGYWGVVSVCHCDTDEVQRDGYELTQWATPSVARAISKAEIADHIWQKMGQPGRAWTQSNAGGWISACLRSRVRAADPDIWELVWAVDSQGRAVSLLSLISYGEQRADRAADARWSAWEVFQARRWAHSKSWNGMGPVPGTGKGSHWRSHPISSPKLGRLARAAAHCASEASLIFASLAESCVAEPALLRLGQKMKETSVKALSGMGGWDDWGDSKPRSESGGWKTARTWAQWNKPQSGCKPEPRALRWSPEDTER